MKVVLAPFGSRGDVAPLLALGQALRARGHDVVAAVPANSAEWTRSLGFTVAPGVPDFRECFDGTHFEGTVLARAMARVGANFAALERAAPGADWIVASMMQWSAASVAERLGTRYAFLTVSPPYLRNRSLPMLMAPFRRTPRFLQSFQWWVSDRAPGWFHAPLDRERVRRGMPRIRGPVFDHVVESGTLFLAADEAVAPTPPDVRALVRAPLHVTPAWVLDEPAPSSAAPALAALDRMLDTPGPPVVYLGFGSMVHGNRARLARLVREAVARAGVRAVLGSGWSGLGSPGAEAPPGAIVLGDVPHALVFPRLAAVVHHGGAGTTATAARAGVPQVVVAHLGDQHYHGWRLHEIGVAPPPLVERIVTPQALAAAIRRVIDDPGPATRARALATGLAGVNGAPHAVDILEAAEAAAR